jgi:hypothetical protein
VCVCVCLVEIGERERDRNRCIHVLGRESGEIEIGRVRGDGG